MPLKPVMGSPNTGRQEGCPALGRSAPGHPRKQPGQLADQENKAISCPKPSKPSSNTSLHLCAEACDAISLLRFSPALNQVKGAAGA